MVEWHHLCTFADRAQSGPRDGFYFGATQAAEAESLRLFADEVGRYVEAPVTPRFASWDEAIRYLFMVAGRSGRPLVLDEFSYLCLASPALPSIIQREFDRAASTSESVSLILCGSALSVMGRLLAGRAPLRGRVSLELIVQPFDHRVAAGYWAVAEPALAARLHAVVGGTPAYRRFVNGDGPVDLADFDRWVCRTVLDPASPLFREARYLLEEEADVRDRALYHSVLAAVAAGNASRGGIASYIGRRGADIGHHLNVLEDCGLLRRQPDVFRSGRTQYRVAEPLVAFYHAVMRPQWGSLESGRAVAVWEDAQARFSAQILGPHFESLCRAFTSAAPATLFGTLPGEVGAGVVADPGRRSQIEVDVVVFASTDPGQPRRILALGEVKWGEVLGVRHLGRLRRARDLLGNRGYDVAGTVLVLFSGAGFDADTDVAEGDGRVLTIGLDDLYAK